MDNLTGICATALRWSNNSARFAPKLIFWSKPRAMTAQVGQVGSTLGSIANEPLSTLYPGKQTGMTPWT